jgi:hypothetical protein
MGELVMMVRTSERMDYKRCRQRWYWRWVKGLISRTSKPALEFGDLYHQALAEYYRPGRKRGPHPAKTFGRLYKARIKGAGRSLRSWDEDDNWMDAGELGVEMLEHYVETYGRDSDIDVIAPEHSFRIPMRDAAGNRIIYVGRFDAIIRQISTNYTGLFEHKTAKSIDEEYLQLDEQAGAYWAFAPWYLRKKGILKRKEELDMILYNFSRKAKKDPRPQNDDGLYLNQDGSISKQQPSKHFLRVPVYRDEPDRKRVIHRIRSEAWEMRMAREGNLPIYKNPMKSCAWDCAFADMCELHETGSDWQEFARMNYNVTKDPYTEYRKALAAQEER